MLGSHQALSAIGEASSRKEPLHALGGRRAREWIRTSYDRVTRHRPGLDWSVSWWLGERPPKPKIELLGPHGVRLKHRRGSTRDGGGVARLPRAGVTTLLVGHRGVEPFELWDASPCLRMACLKLRVKRSLSVR